MLAELHEVMAVGDFLPDILRWIEMVAALVDIAQMHRLADFDRAIVRLFLAGDQLEQRGLARAIGADHADDAARRQAEGEVFEQDLVAERLGQAVRLDHLAAQTFGRLDQDLRLARRAVFLLFDQFVERADTRLGLGLAGLGTLPDPGQLVLDRLLTALVLARFLFESLGLFLQIGGVIAFIDEVARAIELEDPVHHIVQEVAVMGDEDDVAGIIDQMLFQPGDAFGVEMVGRLIEQQDVRLFQQQTGQRHAALFTAGQLGDGRIAGRAAQRFHRQLQMAVERPAVDRIDLFLQRAHFFHERIEIGILGRIAHQRADLVETIDKVRNGANAVHDVFLHRLALIEVRLLRQIADGDILARPCLAGEFLVDARHDLHQRGLAGAVWPDDADLGILIELQIDIAERGLGRPGEGLGHVLHDEAVLGGHVRCFRSIVIPVEAGISARLTLECGEIPVFAGMTLVNRIRCQIAPCRVRFNHPWQEPCTPIHRSP